MSFFPRPTFNLALTQVFDPQATVALDIATVSINMSSHSYHYRHRYNNDNNRPYQPPPLYRNHSSSNKRYRSYEAGENMYNSMAKRRRTDSAHVSIHRHHGHHHHSSTLPPPSSSHHLNQSYPQQQQMTFTSGRRYVDEGSGQHLGYVLHDHKNTNSRHYNNNNNNNMDTNRVSVPHNHHRNINYNSRNRSSSDYQNMPDNPNYNHNKENCNYPSIRRSSYPRDTHNRISNDPYHLPSNNHLPHPHRDEHHHGFSSNHRNQHNSNPRVNPPALRKEFAGQGFDQNAGNRSNRPIRSSTSGLRGLRDGVNHGPNIPHSSSRHMINNNGNNIVSSMPPPYGIEKKNGRDIDRKSQHGNDDHDHLATSRRIYEPIVNVLSYSASATKKRSHHMVRKTMVVGKNINVVPPPQKKKDAKCSKDARFGSAIATESPTTPCDTLVRSSVAVTVPSKNGFLCASKEPEANSEKKKNDDGPFPTNVQKKLVEQNGGHSNSAAGSSSSKAATIPSSSSKCAGMFRTGLRSVPAHKILLPNKTSSMPALRKPIKSGKAPVFKLRSMPVWKILGEVNNNNNNNNSNEMKTEGKDGNLSCAGRKLRSTRDAVAPSNSAAEITLLKSSAIKKERKVRSSTIGVVTWSNKRTSASNIGGAHHQGHQVTVARGDVSSQPVVEERPRENDVGKRNIQGTAKKGSGVEVNSEYAPNSQSKKTAVKVSKEKGFVGSRDGRMKGAVGMGGKTSNKISNEKGHAVNSTTTTTITGKHTGDGASNRSLSGGVTTRGKAQRLGIRKLLNELGEDEVGMLADPLSEKEGEIVTRVTKNVGTGESVVNLSKVGISLMGHDMKRLLGTNWLNDELINAYVHLINERNERIHHQNNDDKEKSGRVKEESKLKIPRTVMLNTFFYTRLMGGRRKSYDFQGVKRWTKRAGIDVLELDQILVPVNIGNNHWVLGVIDMEHKTFHYVDSLQKQDPRGEVLKSLKLWLHDEILDKHGDDLATQMNVDGWKTKQNCYFVRRHLSSSSAASSAASKSARTVEDVPQQKDGGSCGVFMSKIADCLALGIKACVTQEDIGVIRSRMALDLVRMKLPIV